MLASSLVHALDVLSELLALEAVKRILIVEVRQLVFYEQRQKEVAVGRVIPHVATGEAVNS